MCRGTRRRFAHDYRSAPTNRSRANNYRTRCFVGTVVYGAFESLTVPRRIAENTKERNENLNKTHVVRVLRRAFIGSKRFLFFALGSVTALNRRRLWRRNANTNRLWRIVGGKKTKNEKFSEKIPSLGSRFRTHRNFAQVLRTSNNFPETTAIDGRRRKQLLYGDIMHSRCEFGSAKELRNFTWKKELGTEPILMLYGPIFHL